MIKEKLSEKEISKRGALSKVLKRATSEGDERRSYSAKKAHEGKDIGEKGKNFSKIENKASKEYGSKEAGERVAGAIIAKLRSKY